MLSCNRACAQGEYAGRRPKLLQVEDGLARTIPKINTAVRTRFIMSHGHYWAHLDIANRRNQILAYSIRSSVGVAPSTLEKDNLDAFFCCILSEFLTLFYFSMKQA